MKRVLFIVKKGQGYDYSCGRTSSGLFNSAKFVVDMLKHYGVSAHLVQVIDNNDIDREVTKFRPDVVIIEALWVVPEKFKILHKLHPRVQWIVRIHSNTPFLAQEGISVEWISKYMSLPSVHVAFNSTKALEDFGKMSWAKKMLYLPNYYPENWKMALSKRGGCGTLNIGCFGAIRPLKNQLIQAIAAIQYAESVGKTLNFHINSTRVEGGQAVLRNLRALLNLGGHRLVEHCWMDHEHFKHVLSGMHAVMCVSFSETFCIVAADATFVGVPLVCSKEIPWSAVISHASTTDSASIFSTIKRVLRAKSASVSANREGLKDYSNTSKKVWLGFLK